MLFFFNDTATTEIYTLSLHDALPIWYLGDLSVDRAQNWEEFRKALARHKMPAENFVYADVDGNIGYQAAGLSPVRPNWPGLMPVPGWTGDYEWKDWF